MIEFLEKAMEGWTTLFEGKSDYERLHEDYIVGLFDGTSYAES